MQVQVKIKRLSKSKRILTLEKAAKEITRKKLNL